MRKQYGLWLLWGTLASPAIAQTDVPLFRSQDPLQLQVVGSIKSIKKNTNDSTFVSGKFLYENAPGQWTTVSTSARVRGNFRLQTCYFPPLKLKFSKSSVQSTAFEGNKALKLVMPCLNTAERNTLIRKEYLCYRINELVSPYAFRTRLAEMELREMSRKTPRNYKLLTFFVEDNNMVAKRSHGKIMTMRRIDPGAFEEKQAIRNDFFQYMIGNADWSAAYQHNTNVMFANGRYYTLAYDFDMAGFVNAPYARQNPPTLGNGDPRERVYRGFCKTPAAMEQVRREFLDKEAAIQQLIDGQADYFDRRDVQDMHTYLDDFFSILKDDVRFRRQILEGCRTE